MNLKSTIMNSFRFKHKFCNFVKKSHGKDQIGGFWIDL
jgi:hypothetical protein